MIALKSTTLYLHQPDSSEVTNGMFLNMNLIFFCIP